MIRKLVFAALSLGVIGAGMALLMVYAVLAGCCACAAGAGSLIWAAGL